MNRGKNLKSDINQSMVDFRIAVLGAGGSAPTVPADGNFRPTTSTFPKRLNSVSFSSAEVPTRGGAGIYTITYQDKLVNVMPKSAVVLSAGGAPTAVLEATPTIVDPVARTITVKTYVPNGTLTDLGTSDLLVIYVEAQDSGA